MSCEGAIRHWRSDDLRLLALLASAWGACACQGAYRGQGQSLAVGPSAGTGARAPAADAATATGTSAADATPTAGPADAGTPAAQDGAPTAAGPCQALAKTFCTLAQGPCPDLESALLRAGVSDERCRAGNEALSGIESQPLMMQAAIAGRVLAEVTGTEKLRQATHDALLCLSLVEDDLRARRSPEENLRKLREVGPLACVPLLSRYRETAPSKLRRMLHRLLVELRGRNLGTAADAWQEWCNQVVRAHVARPTAEPPQPPPDLIDDEPPISYVPSVHSDSPECRARFADFSETWQQARKCDRDDDCTIVIGTCAAARADLKSALQDRLAAIGPCVQLIALPHCLDTRAVCFEQRCRARGRRAETLP